jgi:antiviral helicase SLH1
MCSASEFDELPVRHNEDLINAELALYLPLSVESMGDLPMWDPHVKAFLLLQAYMSRIDLPISDYVGDQISVLDQGIRVIQASIDVLAELGYISACRQMMALLQCIKSARWPSDHHLSILPGIEPENPPKPLPTSLAALSALPESSISSLSRKLHFTTATANQFTKAASSIPNLSVSVSDVTSTGMTVTLTRQNPHMNPEYKIFAPRFPKPQTEGYFLIVTAATPNGGDGEMLALKRVSWPSVVNHGRGGKQGHRHQKNGNTIAKSSVKFPEEVIATEQTTTTRIINVRVVSDAYPGMEWTVSGVTLPFYDDISKKSTQDLEPSKSNA